jgi:hypothetical protein
MEPQTDLLTFSSTFPVVVFQRKPDNPMEDWQELDRGPGIFHILPGHEVMVRIKNIDNDILYDLVRELAGCSAVTFLNLAENRKVTDDGLESIKPLSHLKGLNLSSCSLNDAGIRHLTTLHQLVYLNLSYCNRLTDLALKPLRGLTRLTYLDLQGCVKITHAGVAHMRRRELTIHK